MIMMKEIHNFCCFPNLRLYRSSTFNLRFQPYEYRYDSSCSSSLVALNVDVVVVVEVAVVVVVVVVVLVEDEVVVQVVAVVAVVAVAVAVAVAVVVVVVVAVVVYIIYVVRRLSPRSGTIAVVASVLTLTPLCQAPHTVHTEGPVPFDGFSLDGCMDLHREGSGSKATLSLTIGEGLGFMKGSTTRVPSGPYIRV